LPSLAASLAYEVESTFQSKQKIASTGILDKKGRPHRGDERPVSLVLFNEQCHLPNVHIEEPDSRNRSALLSSFIERSSCGCTHIANSKRATFRYFQQLRPIVLHVIAFRDIIDGDTDKEVDDEDRCSAHDDSMEVPELNAGFGLPGDPGDAEEDDPIEGNHDVEEQQWSEPRL
jgi:hypothetical protein